MNHYKHPHIRFCVNLSFHFFRIKTQEVGLLLYAKLIKFQFFKENQTILQCTSIILPSHQQCMRLLEAPCSHQNLAMPVAVFSFKPFHQVPGTDFPSGADTFIEFTAVFRKELKSVANVSLYAWELLGCMPIKHFIFTIPTRVTLTRSVQFCLVVYIPSNFHANFLVPWLKPRVLCLPCSGPSGYV